MFATAPSPRLASQVEADLAETASKLKDQTARYEADMAELEELRKKLAAAQQDLTRERRKVQNLKNQRDTAAALNVDLKKADPKVAGVLENRVKVRTNPGRMCCL